MKPLFALISGLIFGIGLLLSGMTNPAKVVNFLDITGSWDPSLIFVMGAAVAVTLPGFYLVNHSPRPLFHPRYYMPTSRDIDARLVTGSALFGVGWGLGGFCPGPALTALPTGVTDVLVFVAALCAGLIAANLWTDRRTRQHVPT